MLLLLPKCRKCKEGHVNYDGYDFSKKVPVKELNGTRSMVTLARAKRKCVKCDFAYIEDLV